MNYQGWRNKDDFMSAQIGKQQDELAKLIQRHVAAEGVHATEVTSLFFMRHSNVTGPTYGVYKPSFCIVVQGAKVVWLAQERFK
jgi:hypothetical protein